MGLSRNPSATFEFDVHGPGEVRPEHPGAVTAQPFQRLRRRMAVGIARARGDDGDGGPDRRQEGLRGCRAAAVVGNLEDVHAGDPALEQDRIDVLLRVAHQEEPVPVHGPQQHDRDVVDGRAGVRRPARDRARVRPQHPERDAVERDRVAGREPLRAPAMREEPRRERTVARTRPQHAGLQDAAHSIALEEPGQPGDVVLVRVGEDQQVDSPVPGRHPAVECDEEPCGIGSAVHEHPGAPIALHEDGVALPDIEHVDPHGPVCPVRRDQDEAGDRGGERHRQQARGAGRSAAAG